MSKIKNYLEKRKKEYEESLNQSNMLSLYLMEKDKKELVGIIIGILMGGQLK